MNYWIVLVALFCLAENCGAAALLVWLLRKRGKYSKALVVAICLWTALMCAMFLVNIIALPEWKTFVRAFLYLPMAVGMVWNILLLQAFVPLVLFAALIILRRRRKAAALPGTPEGISRRNFLYAIGCGAVPAVSVGLGVHGLVTREDLQKREFNLAITGLPASLHGFTIAHLSDLHSGIFVGPRRLKIMSDAANDLKADLVVVTGDLINRGMDEFTAAVTALRRIESRYGMYLCEGNHDVIPGDGLVVEACAQNRLPMLYNSSVTLPVEQGRLIIAGLPWEMHPPDIAPSDVTGLFPAHAPGDVRLLLAHHPHVFDVAQGVDVLLCGHTHGGQIMFGEVGLGRLRFKYCSGRFDRPGTSMIVSNGCGDWFPCRIGAPAEIGLIRLLRA